MNFSSYVCNENRIVIERLAEIQKLLVNLSSENFEKTKELIANSIFMTSEHLFNMFYSVISKTALSFYSKITLYLSLFDMLKPNFIPLIRGRAILNDSSPFIASLLYDPINERPFSCKDIEISFNINKIQETPENLLYFLPEINPKKIEQIRNSYLSDICQQFIDDYEKGIFLQYRQQGLNQDPFAKIIREDDIDKFNDLWAKNEIKFNTPIQFSIYERGDLVSDPIFRPTPIFYAAYYGAENIFNRLFEQYNDSFELLLPYAMLGDNHNIITTVLNSNPEFNMNDLSDYFPYLKNIFFDEETFEQINLDNENVFLDSILTTNAILINEIDDSIDFNKTNERGENIFQIYCSEFNDPISNMFFFNKYYDIDYFHKDNNGDTVVHTAARTDQLTLIEYLKYYPGFDSSTPDYDEVTPLYYAIKNQNDLLINLFTRDDSDCLNYFGKDGSSIYVGINNYQDDCFKRILSNSSVDVNKLSPQCQFPYQYAMEKDNLQAFSCIISRMPKSFYKFDSESEDSIIRSAIMHAKYNPVFLEHLIYSSQMGYFLKEKDKNGIKIFIFLYNSL